MKHLRTTLRGCLLPATVALLIGCQSSADRNGIAPVVSYSSAPATTASAGASPITAHYAAEAQPSNYVADSAVKPEVQNAAYVSAVQPQLDNSAADRSAQQSTVGILPATATQTQDSLSADSSVAFHLTDGPVNQEPLPQGASSPALTLDDALAFALFNNPDLRAARGNEWSFAEAINVAQTYPWNPNIQVNYAPRALSHVEPTWANYYVFVLQTFELGHQRRYREQIASANLNQTRWTIHQAELTAMATALRQYLTAVYQRDLFELAREAADLNENLHGTVQRRYKAGLSTAAEQTLTGTALRQAQRQAQLAEANYKTALRMLYQTIGSEVVEGAPLQGALVEYEWQPIQNAGEQAVGISLSRTEMAAALAQSRPDVLAAEAFAQSARANEGLARASKIPNMQAGPIYTSDDFKNQFLGVRVFMDAPVFNTGEPLRRQRHAEWHQRRLAVDELRRRAGLEAQAAIARYEHALHFVATSRDDFSESTPAALRSIREQFEAGQATILDVIAVQNALLQDRRTFLDALNELSQATADVVQATAIPPQRLVSPASAGHVELPPQDGGAP